MHCHWELRADLETRLKFPDLIVQTSLCPDWKLTVPWEEHVKVTHEQKKFNI